ncbi:hypothetical protein Drorol1_Dr00027832 [Drosera rotundifolia]
MQPEATAIRSPISGPFTQGIHNVPFPPGLRMPSFDLYDGTTDPEDHTNIFEIRMQLYNVEDAILCRAFPSTFKGAARKLFTSLAPRQGANELLRDFMSRFNRTYIQIPGLREEVAIVALETGLLSGPFGDNLILKPPRNFRDLLHRARSYMTLDDRNRSRALLKAPNSITQPERVSRPELKSFKRDSLPRKFNTARMEPPTWVGNETRVSAP